MCFVYLSNTLSMIIVYFNTLGRLVHMSDKNNRLSPVEIFGHIADLKQTDYKNTLAIAAIIEVLLEKDIITKEELLVKSRQLDS